MPKRSQGVLPLEPMLNGTDYDANHDHPRERGIVSDHDDLFSADSSSDYGPR